MIRSIKVKINQWKQFKINLRQTRPTLGAIVQWLEMLLGALVIALVLRQFVIQSSLVFSGSMIPTLQSATQTQFADRLIVNKLVYHFNAPSRGDIMLFHSPYNDGKQYVKRVIGLPGDSVEIRRGMVYINQKLLVIPGVTIRRDYATMPPIIVPAKHYFMLGDNRPNSADSRVWGFVPESQIIGEALFIYWPFSRIRWVR
ncbi:MAG: signal peptidase I [Candidatus Marinamargulisbacteria bacterium]